MNYNFEFTCRNVIFSVHESEKGYTYFIKPFSYKNNLVKNLIFINAHLFLKIQTWNENIFWINGFAKGLSTFSGLKDWMTLDCCCIAIIWQYWQLLLVFQAFNKNKEKGTKRLLNMLSFISALRSCKDRCLCLENDLFVTAIRILYYLFILFSPNII